MIANILAEEGLQIYWQSNVCCKYIGRGMSAVVKLRAWVKCMREYWQNMCSTETAYCTLYSVHSAGTLALLQKGTGNMQKYVIEINQRVPNWSKLGDGLF